MHGKIIVLSSLFVLLTMSGCSSSIDNYEDTTSSESDEHSIFEFNFSEKIDPSYLEESLQTWLQNDVTKETKLTSEDFWLIVLPMNDGLYFLQQLLDYNSRRYSDKEIRDAYANDSLYIEGQVKFYLNLLHAGGYQNEKSIPIGDNFYEYFFLENEKGEYLRASSQEKSWSLSEINSFTSSGTVILSFDEDEIDALMNGNDELYLTFDALELFEENRVPIKYPFSKYYETEYPETTSMLEDLQ